MPWGSQEPEIEWFMDIRNPKHPYYSEYKEIQKDEIFRHPLVHDWSGGLDSACVQTFPYKLSYFKEQILTEIMSNIDDIVCRLKKCMRENHQIVLYGIGIVGKVLAEQLTKRNMEPAYIIDKYKTCCRFQNIGVYKLEEVNELSKEVDVLVTPLLDFETIDKNLEKLGYTGKRIHITEIIGSRDLICKILKTVN